MAGAGGLAAVLLGGLIGFIFAILAIGLAIHGLTTRNPRRGFATSIIALALSVLAIVLSAPIWRVLLSGYSTHGEPLDYGEMTPVIFLIVLETIAVVVSVPGAVRRTLRRLS